MILGEAYRDIREMIEVEATVKGIMPDSNVNLDYWVNTPSEVFIPLCETDLNFNKIEQKKHRIQFKPGSEGIYSDAYLTLTQIK